MQPQQGTDATTTATPLESETTYATEPDSVPIYLNYLPNNEGEKVDLNNLNGIQIKKTIEDVNGGFKLLLEKIDTSASSGIIGNGKYTFLEASSDGQLDIKGDLNSSNTFLSWSTAEEIAKSKPESVFNFFDILFPNKELKLISSFDGTYKIISSLHGEVNLTNFPEKLELEEILNNGDIDGEFSGDGAGYSVNLSGDGSVVAISSPFHDHNKGQVKIFEYNSANSGWNSKGNPIEGQWASDNLFGFSVSLSTDGSVVAISAADTGNADNEGIVQIFEYVSSTSRWVAKGHSIPGGQSLSSTTKLSESNFFFDIPLSEGIIDTTGSTGISGFSDNSVSLSADGSIVAISSTHHDGNKGKVQIYEYVPLLMVLLTAGLGGNPIEGQSGDYLGYSVSLSADGSTVAISSTHHDGNKGKVQIFEFDIDQGNWNKIGSDINGHSTDDLFGYSISLSANGSILAIGAPVNPDISTDSKVKIYVRNNNQWIEIGEEIGNGSEILGSSVESFC